MLRERWHNVALTLVNYARVKDSYSNSRDVRERSFQLKKESFVLIVEFRRKIFSFENKNIKRYSKYFETKYIFWANIRYKKMENFLNKILFAWKTFCPDC